MNQLQEAQLTNPQSQATVYRWCKQFADRTRTSLLDLERSGPLSFLYQFRSILPSLQSWLRKSLSNLCDLQQKRLGSAKTLLDSLGMRKVYSVSVLHELSMKNKRDRVSCEMELIKFMDEHSVEECLKFWAVEDKTWILHQYLKSKQDNIAWFHPSTPKPRVVRPKLSNEKVILILAFMGGGNCYIRYVAPEEKITSERYVKFMHKHRENWRKLRS